MNDIVYNFGDYNEKIVDKINLILGDDYTPYYRKTGITFYYNNQIKEFLNWLKSKNGLK